MINEAENYFVDQETGIIGRKGEREKRFSGEKRERHDLVHTDDD